MYEAYWTPCPNGRLAAAVIARLPKGRMKLALILSSGAVAKRTLIPIRTVRMHVSSM